MPASDIASDKRRGRTAAMVRQPTLILGSTSVYRRSLLERLRIPFRVVGPEVDESPLPGEAAPVTARRLSQAKAMAVARQHPGSVVIGSDQVADLDGRPLGKPGTHERAVRQLLEMSAKTVLFHTSVTVLCLDGGYGQTESAAARVKFRELGRDEIDAYLLAERPYDCAGSARSEGLGIALLESIDSDDPTTLVGLPLMRTCAMLRAAGIRIL
jgi:septum formation protein